MILPGPARALALADLDGDGIDDCIWLDGSRLQFASSQGVSTSIQVTGIKHGLRVLPGDGPDGIDSVARTAPAGVRVVVGRARSSRSS